MFLLKKAMVPIMTTELEVMPISPLVLYFDVDEPVIHGFGNLLCFANVRVLSKPPWLLCVEIPRLMIMVQANTIDHWVSTKGITMG
jgi:hypothetical protein